MGFEPDIDSLTFEPSHTDERERVIPVNHIKERTARTKALRARTARAFKQEQFADVIGPGLKPGEALHVISRGYFDSVTIPVWFARNISPIRTLDVSTLTVSRASLDDLQALIDDGLLGRVRIVMQEIGLTRSHRRGDVDAIHAFIERSDGHILRIAETHAKIQLIELENDQRIAVESSANLTSNDSRIEQYAIHACPDVYAFHYGWMQEIFDVDHEGINRGWFPGNPPRPPRNQQP